MNVTPEQAAEILQIIQAKYPREFENGFLTWRLAMAEQALAASGPRPEAVTSDGHTAGQVVPMPVPGNEAESGKPVRDINPEC